MVTSAHQAGSTKLRELRVRAGLTPGQLAELAGCSRRTIQRAEQGHVPVFVNQRAIARALTHELRLAVELDHLDLWPLVEDEQGAATR
jgi:transcriptional regulator with XRE-family HTH domain